jgi:hypothetical protein
MGATGMKVTVMGAVLAIAAIVAVLMLLNIILDQKRSGSNSDGNPQ